MNTESIKNEIQKGKDLHKLKMDGYDKEVSDYIDEYGTNPTDYLMYRQYMAYYHHGAWNALNELERELK